MGFTFLVMQNGIAKQARQTPILHHCGRNFGMRITECMPFQRGQRRAKLPGALLQQGAVSQRMHCRQGQSAHIGQQANRE